MRDASHTVDRGLHTVDKVGFGDETSRLTTTLPVSQQAPTVTATIDGREITVPEGTTIYDAAKQVGVEIPVLCHN